MSVKRKSKMITDKDTLDVLLNLTENQITTTFIMEMFGEFEGKSRLNPYDLLTIPPNTYGPNKKKNKNSFVTTVGIWIFNKYFIEPHLFDLFHYINKPISGKVLEELNNKMSYALLEDEITTEQLRDFLDKTQKVTPYVSVLSYNFTEALMLSGDNNDKEKKRLMSKYKDRIEQGDGKAAEELEKELLSNAKEKYADDPGMDCFNSGLTSWGNNYKNMFVMKGAIRSTDPDETKYNIVLDNYINGVSRDNYSIMADALTEGPYSRGLRTQVGGYWEKLFIRAFQHITLDEAGSDCGTKHYITVKLDNIEDYMYSYVIEGNKLVEITSKNMEHYRGKTVKLRFSSMCKSKTGICNKCAGNFFYRIGLKNIGAATPVIPSRLKLRALKAFHDSVVKFKEMDIEKAFGSDK